jgi:hypothetical protein
MAAGEGPAENEQFLKVEASKAAVTREIKQRWIS